MPVTPSDAGPVVPEDGVLALQRIESMLPEGMQRIIADARRLLAEVVSLPGFVHSPGDKVAAVAHLNLRYF